jgi:hypothetical protein
MRTHSRSRGRVLILAALTLVAGLPELARAQQTGLFPLHSIKRQRVPCDQEDPIYKAYKTQYFGYHPTCWRTFPAGWGCPSPEAPDKNKSFQELPLASGERSDTPDENEPDAGAMPGQPGANRPNLPPLQGGARSPFETDDPAAAPRNPRGAPNPLPTPPGDPFELDKPDAPAAPRTGQGRPANPGSASNGPELTAPAESAPPTQGARTSSNDNADDPRNNADDGPVLALPKVNLPAIDDSGVPFGTLPPTPPASTANADAGTAAPRRGLLSGFFSNLGLNWVRR